MLPENGNQTMGSSSKNSRRKLVSESRLSRRRSLGSTSSDSSASDTDFVSLLDPPVKSRFTSGSFLKASKIIRSIKNGGEKEDRPVFASDEERILTYELTVAILKYSTFLREALEKSNFYGRNPHLGPNLANVGQEELLVILYDLIEREFRIAPEDLELPKELAALQTAILASKTKLLAHIAKLRIKHEASTLENLLPTNLRHQHNIDKNPLYFWVNLRKVPVVKIVTALRSQRLEETRFEDDTLIQENLFSVSSLHPDLIRMNSSKSNSIKCMPIFRDGYIVVQDKSACLPVYVLAKALYFKEAVYHRGAGMENLNPFPNGDPPEIPSTPYISTSLSLASSLSTSTSGAASSEYSEEWYQGILEGPGRHFSKPDCVVVSHCGPGRSAAHLAMLLCEGVPRYLSRSVNMSTQGNDLVKAIKSKFVYRPPLTVVVFGTPHKKHDEISKYIKKTLGITNIRLYSEDFINVKPKDSRIRGCGAILVNPPSSGSALKDPVSYICSEGGDEQVLAQYSQFVSSATKEKGGGGTNVKYSPNQAKYLNHALSIPNVKLVLYTTCSNLACENTEVVRVCLSEATRREETRKCQVYASIVMQSQSKLFRDVSFEVVPIDKLMEGYDKEDCLAGSFVDMHPSSACSGVFMALIRRRDRQVNMAKNPVKQFVQSQMAVKGDGGGGGGGAAEVVHLLEQEQISMTSSRTPSLANFSMASTSFTEQELAQYLIRKLNLDNTTEEELMSGSGVLGGESSRKVPVFEANMKKRASKKAIVKRVSTPTHSSMQRQTEKFSANGGGGSASGSYPNSGAQTPRSGTRTPTIMPIPDLSKPRQTHANAPCNSCHHGGHEHVCVCARHAKKFPEVLKNL